MSKIVIYISYAWRGREKDPAPDDRETIVGDFCKACEERGYTVKRDKMGVITALGMNKLHGKALVAQRMKPL